MIDRMLVRLAAGGLDEMKRALAAASLPTADLDDGSAACFRLEDETGPLGWGAFALYGRDALLRSVVVAAGRRGAGAGSDLTGRILRAAAAAGARRAWLLTETAADFFAGLGFAPTERASAPDAIRRTAEFDPPVPGLGAVHGARSARGVTGFDKHRRLH